MATTWKCNLCLTMNNEGDNACELCGTERQLGCTQVDCYESKSIGWPRVSQAPSHKRHGDVTVFDFTVESVEDIEPTSYKPARTSPLPKPRGQSSLPLSIESYGSEHDTESASEDNADLPRATSSTDALSGFKRSRKATQTAAVKEAKGAVKAAKLAAKEAEKAFKLVQRVADRSARGSYAQQEVAMYLEQDFAASDNGKSITESVDADYSVIAPRVHDIANSIHWVRRRVDPASKGTSFLAGHETVEPFVAVFWEGSTYVENLKGFGTDGIESFVRSARKSLPQATRLLFIVQGAAQYIAEQLKKADAARRRGKADVSAVLTQDGLDAANMYLYVTCELEIRDTTTAADTIDYLRGLSRAIAELPYRMQPSALAVVTKIHVSRAPALGGSDVEDEDGGLSAVGKQTRNKTLTETWMAQLQMIPGLSDKKAAAIVAKYPTLRSLMNFYRDSSVNAFAKETALEDVAMDSTNRKMTKLSRDIFRFFTTKNPDEVIGSEAGT